MSDTRTEIVDLAEKLVRSKGYHAFSYRDISVPLHIKNAAIHYYFPVKADLGLAIIQRIMDLFCKQTDQWKYLSPMKKLESFINIYEKSRKQNLVCFMGALGPSFESLPQPMKEKLTSASKHIRTWLTEVLREGHQTGQFSFEESFETKSNIIITALLSSLILNKVTEDDVLGSVKNYILMNVKRSH